MMNMPRICQVMLARGFGGAERLYVDLCISLHEKGYPLLAICHPEGVARQRLQDAGVPNAGIRSLGWWDPLAPARIRHAVTRFGADIVHTHLARATHLVARAQMSVPFVASLHNYGKRKYYKSANHFVPITRDGANHLVNQGVTGDRITVIPNFSRFATAPGVRKKPHQPIQLLAYGRFVEKKGFHVLLASLGRLHDAGFAFELVLAGDGPAAQVLRQQAAQLGIASRIHWPGWLDDVEAALDSADLFILPSLDEPFGIVVLEAMARGVPMVSTRTQGPREVLADDTAYLCEPDNVADLEKAIRTAVADETGRGQRSETALQQFRDHYSAEVVVPRFAQLYRQLLARMNNRQPG